MPLKPVSTYLTRLAEIRNTGKGTPELSYRAALENLLNEVGRHLDRPVHATHELADPGDGTGHPDFGIFDKKSANLCCVIEVKPDTDDVPETADGTQVARYWKRYGTVLVTNYRDFLLIVRDPAGGAATVEGRYSLASTAEAFRRAAPRTLAKEHETGLADFLTGVFLRHAPITKPKDLAADLARHAREAKRRLSHQPPDSLRPLQESFEQSLGLQFDDKDGLDFFRSSLVQTLFYGLFSGWMLWCRNLPKGRKAPAFDWKDASEHLALPLIGDLFEEIAKPRRLADLGLRQPLEWATSSLNRVEREEFFRGFDEEHAITLFYEPFLQAFDPHLRKELGVWYTPPEIVKYMVGRVDQLLRSELKIADGLADENVYVLDPAAGTGSYLVEVARRIHQTHVENNWSSLDAAKKVKKALCSRVFGFEILPAPYVVSHLQLGVLLKNLSAPLAANDRAGMFLTNALTGWEPPKGAKKTLPFAFLQDEQDAAAKVKRDAPIIVILGNPPYNGFAGVTEDEEADLIAPYKQGLYEKWGVRKQLLDDLYIRFFRLGEKRIAEVARRGIVCYISNYSWLDGLSHPIMRERILTHFDLLYIDNCNGDKYKTGKRTPDGKPDESMFTTDDHRVGIQVGTAIATMIANGKPKRSSESQFAEVLYREMWGLGNVKREALLKSISATKKGYSPAHPTKARRWVVARSDGEHADLAYDKWPRLLELFPVHYSGLNENRGGAFITIDREVIERRMQSYFDKRLSLDDLAAENSSVATNVVGYDPQKARFAMLASRQFDSARIVPVCYRPFDVWWTYWEGEHKLFNRPRPDLFEQVVPGSLFIAASQTARKGGLNELVVTDKLGDLHLQDPWSQFFPLHLHTTGELGGDRVEPNIDPNTLDAVCKASGVVMHGKDGHSLTDQARGAAELVFFHALAVLWSPAYRTDNATALRQDWPRVPIPMDPEVLKASAALGRQVADLLLPDKPVPGVTTGKLRAELKHLAVPERSDGKPIDADHDLEVTATWGFRGQKNAVMCGKGKVSNHAAADDAVDVWINDRVCWRNVPRAVWAMTIGGYRVIKKWLSYREKRVFGRALRMEEMTYITDVARRLQALLLLGTELDENYRACAAETVQLPPR